MQLVAPGSLAEPDNMKVVPGKATRRAIGIRPETELPDNMKVVPGKATVENRVVKFTMPPSSPPWCGRRPDG